LYRAQLFATGFRWWSLTSATEEITSDFPCVADLGGEAAETAAESLSTVCDELTKSGVDTAVRRMRNVDAVVATMPFPVVERLVAPDRVLAELDEVQTRPVRRLHSLRNQAALFPLLLTWLSIGFVVLSQNDTALVPILGTVALVDALLIGWVVMLTRQVHSREQAATREYDRIAEQLDAAIRSLATAMASHAARSPANAEEWADATRAVLEDARRQTTELFEATKATVDQASANLTSVHTETEKLVTMLAEQSRKTLESLQQANEQMVTRVAKEAVAVLNSAVAEDRALVGEQLAPLVEQFQANVESFGRGFESYQENTAAFVAVTSDVGVATKALGDSAKSYTDIAESIEAHLRNIEGSQQTFIQQVTESARNMGTAAGAMETMSTLLSDRLRADLETITVQLNSSSARLAAVDTNLVTTTEALGQAAGQLRGAADALGGAAKRRRRPWRR
jgi:hypothetical protein